MRAIRDLILTMLLSAFLAGGFFAADFGPQLLWLRPDEPSYRPSFTQKFVSGFFWGGSVGAVVGCFVALNRLTDPPNDTA
jgi:hypothetical protein